MKTPDFKELRRQAGMPSASPGRKHWDRCIRQRLKSFRKPPPPAPLQLLLSLLAWAGILAGCLILVGLAILLIAVAADFVGKHPASTFIIGIFAFHVVACMFAD